MKVQTQTASTSDIIRSLPTLPKDQLLALWQEHFGLPAKKLRRELLIPVLAFRIQEKTHGGLNADVARRIREIADTLTPKGRNQNESRHRFKTGTRLVREWKGQIHEVTLTDDGYEHQGKIYKSLSPIASAITGTNWSGPAFFGTKKKGIKQ
jgi:hypothetical protein